MKPAPRMRRRLSDREDEVMRLVCIGKTNYEISELLGITEATVKAHVTHVMAKMGVSNRAQVLLKALIKRIVTVKSLKTAYQLDMLEGE